MSEATLVATLKKPPSFDGCDLTAVREADWLEVRADLVGWIDPAWLRNAFRGLLLFTLRSKSEGGAFAGSDSERRELLLRASRGYDLIDLEASRDLHPELLSAIPPRQRLISTHEMAPHNLEASFARLSSIDARFYKLVSHCSSAGDGLAPLRLLRSLKRSDVIAYGSGQAGLWSRLIAPRLGAPVVFGLAEHANNGEPTLARMIEDYGLPKLGPLDEMYGIVGNPVSQSLSPRLHNAAYRAVSRRALFLPFQVESFGDFWRDFEMGKAFEPFGVAAKGLTVVSPHKETALAAAGATSAMVRQAGSTNIFIRNNGHWEADTTDPQGVALALRHRGIRTRSARAAVVGCGGAGRAVAAALTQEGAKVLMVNRGLERGRRAVELLHLPFQQLSTFTAAGFDIVVNATPVGRDGRDTPFEIDGLASGAVVIDLAYGPSPTPLTLRARARGLITIDGREVLLIQVAQQFRLMTGCEMPEGLAREVLGSNAMPAAPGVAGQRR
ncbi:MAG TPA: type I 3-dehydroquinate dehydratase [Blastocatellia bacterium]|jgi:3-dehydroquinate dehydratase/shikimate dehydrogenase|nr:type I 3-dehydroquinate dehydratase [Blastocatellia bacterium]